MHFLWVNVMFYDAVNIIHDVIITMTYTAKVMMVLYHSPEYLAVQVNNEDKYQIDN